MVNVPPIPPLLSSTPPPIDFGEDEDVDILPPALDVINNDDFGDFLTDDDSKCSEPLPSPRFPSEYDLPPVNIIDGLIEPEKKEGPRNITSSPPIDDQINKNAMKTKKSKEITEAFNFDVKNIKENAKQNEQDENKKLSIELTETELKFQKVLYTESEKILENRKTECLELTKSLDDTTSLIKNINHLTIIETTSNLAAKTSNSSNKTFEGCIENMVSIEDLDDDFSDDELYSPKTPKNFMEDDSLNDYFKIAEITTTYNSKIKTKSNYEDVNAKSLTSLDNNESVSLENDNDNECKSCSSNSLIQNSSNMPPSTLQDDSNSVDDDFSDFAAFQDLSTASTVTPPETNIFVNKTVPVNNNNNKQHNNINLRYKNFDGFNNYSLIKQHLDTAEQAEEKFVASNFTIEDEATNKKEQFELNTPTQASLKANDKFVEAKQNSLDLEIKSQKDLSGVNYTINTLEDFKESLPDNQNSPPIEKNINIHNNFKGLNAAVNNNEGDNFENFAEFSMSPQIPRQTNKDDIINDDGEDFNDFADFESCSVQPQAKESLCTKNPIYTNKEDIQSHDKENNDSTEGFNDDDFGDFNTAQPITPTASNITNIQTSQNTSKTFTPVVPLYNLQEHISKILQLMFIPTIDAAGETANTVKTQKIQDIPFTSIDAAKALEYQWLNSNTRHSFIRSLGIDSRNILFGENWNSSLPRFAANLSFNPLKPMKPVQSLKNSSEAHSVLQPNPVCSIEPTKSLDVSIGPEKETSETLEWKIRNEEQTTEVLKDNGPTSVVASTPTTNLISCVTHKSYLADENHSDNEDKYSDTPPISEMESVTAFSTPVATPQMEIVLPPIQVTNDIDEFHLNEVEKNFKNIFNTNEVMVTSTYTGSFKETHIFTPSKVNEYENRHVSPSLAPLITSLPTKATHIDFDYEKAAMGVIIDETVVKKEYRDVEYNPPFTMESLSKIITTTTTTNIFDVNAYVTSNASANIVSSTDVNMSLKSSTGKEDLESNDDFSEFQSVSSEVTVPAESVILQSKAAVTTSKPLEESKIITVSHGGMILSPAILIPQAISLKNHKPKIEWGDSSATINPEEMARIEELFPDPMSLKSSTGSNSSQKSTPTRHVSSAPSISATVSSKELEVNINNINDDDDDWSDFVSVTIMNNAPTNKAVSNNNILGKISSGSSFKQRSSLLPSRISSSTILNNSNNDDEWSEFVSSTPPSQQPTSYKVPQFNSGAWQNANFYNNPLSMYHKRPINVPTGTGATHPSQKFISNNNNNYNMSQQSYPNVNNISPIIMGNIQVPANNAHQQQQKIHIMQNFSTSPSPTPERLATAAAGTKNNQFQSIGSAKVAPSIALIPDLGFVAPAIPTHTSFINSLPKSNINTKK